MSISQASLDPCDNLSHGKAGECIDPRKDDSSLPPPACAGPQGCQERCPAGLHGSCLQGRSQLPWPACRQRCAGRPPMPAAAASCASESQVCSPVVSASICNQGWHPCQLGNLLRRRPALYLSKIPIQRVSRLRFQEVPTELSRLCWMTSIHLEIALLLQISLVGVPGWHAAHSMPAHFVGCPAACSFLCLL